MTLSCQIPIKKHNLGEVDQVHLVDLVDLPIAAPPKIRYMGSASIKSGGNSVAFQIIMNITIVRINYHYLGCVSSQPNTFGNHQGVAATLTVSGINLNHEEEADAIDYYNTSVTSITNIATNETSQLITSLTIFVFLTIFTSLPIFPFR